MNINEYFEIPPYQITGPQNAPVIVALGGISANREVTIKSDGGPGWWSWLVGVDKTVNEKDFRILSFDYPQNISHPQNEKYITTHQQAELLKTILNHLKIDKILLLIGASYGGMVGLSFAALFPDTMEHLVVIAAAHKSSPYSVGLRSVQRKILQTLGKYDPVESVSLARSLAMLTYRTSEEIDERFTNEITNDKDPDSFPVWSYLHYKGNQYAKIMTMERFLSLSRSIDHHYVRPEDIKIPMTVIACKQDILVPMSYAEELVNTSNEKSPHVSQLIKFDSKYGHDAFLKEEPSIQKAIAEILKNLFYKAS
ncbi:MAG: alpha/beta fold hydrolase [Bacteriovoracaceae bacterium]|nr:alpha/beta fold hydrolase [Bacteriovoracaceae bacterium]